MKAYKYDSDFYYIGEQECQLDPIATKREGHEVWLLPANCTWEEPPKEKEGFRIKWNGSAWEYEEIPVPPAPEPPTLEEAKANKINEFKSIRDTKEVEPVEYNNSLFDFDSKSYERILAAIYALDDLEKISWTTADDQIVEVTSTDLKNVIKAAAARSNLLHNHYRDIKAQVNNASSFEELEAITW